MCYEVFDNLHFRWRQLMATRHMNRAVVAGWIMELLGTAFWIYGYFTIGHSSPIALPSRTPWWIADYLQNLETQLGMVIMLAGVVLVYWPSRPQPAKSQNSDLALRDGSMME